MKVLTKDDPIESKKEDKLGRAEFSEDIANAIYNYHLTKDSLTIGLFGKWGSGKSSVINMVVENIEEKDKDKKEDEEVIVFRFEPWLFSDTQQLVSNFFKVFANNIATNGEELCTLIKDYAQKLDPLVKQIPYIGEILSNRIANNLDKDLQTLKKEIKAKLADFNQRILIIIDDIDRLNDTEVRQVFQLMKALGDFPNTIYLSSMDREIVIEALKKVQSDNGSEYLEKIINVTFNIPDVSKTKVHSILFKGLDEIIDDSKDNEFDKRYWRNIFYSGYGDFFLNVRDVVRYMNTLKFKYLMLKHKVNIIDLMAITGFEVFEPKIYEFIKQNKDFFVHSEISKNEEIKSFIENSYRLLQKLNQKTYLNLLKELFILIKEVYDDITYSDRLTTLRKESKISSPNFFDTYFTLTLEDDQISNYDMKAYINSASDENQFRDTIKSLINNKKIILFLDRLLDFISDAISREKIQPIINTLLDLGDKFQEKESSMFDIPNNWKILLVIKKLLTPLPNEKDRLEILKKSIEDCNESIGTICQVIFHLIIREKEDEKNLINEEKYLQELKNLIQKKIKNWIAKENLLIHKDALAILLSWKKIDEKSATEYIQNSIKNETSLCQFLNIFITYYYSHTEGDYTEKKNEKYSYTSLKKLIEPDDIIDKVRLIHSNIKNEYFKALDMFIKHYYDILKEDRF